MTSNNDTQRLFLSDLHLESPDSPQFRGLARLLGTHPAREIYLLGDIVGLWIGDDDDAPLAEALKALLSRTAGHANVFLMHGNRDFLFGNAFCHEAGVTLLPDPWLLEDGTLLSHGDGYCTGDAEYQTFRAMVRSETWQADILAKSIDERRAFGQALRAQSRETNANKAQNIMDVNAAAVGKDMSTHRARTLIHGHTHRPGFHPEQSRYVLGAWERCGWFIEQAGQNFTLNVFKL